jgi:hypothetical protein
MVDSSYFCFRNSLPVFMPVRPQKLSEVGSPCCEAKVVKAIWPSAFVPRQTVARFYVAARFVTLAHWNKRQDSDSSDEQRERFHGGKL